jgi:hypothetical protein
MEWQFEAALKKGEVLAYLAGDGVYSIRDEWDAGPTDMTAAFQAMEGHLLRDETVRNAFLDALVMLARDPQKGWMAMEYLDSWFAFGRKEDLPGVPGSVLSKISASLLTNRTQLEKNHNWSGKAMQNGVWGIVESLNRVLFAEYGVNILAMGAVMEG